MLRKFKLERLEDAPSYFLFVDIDKKKAIFVMITSIFALFLYETQFYISKIRVQDLLYVKYCVNIHRSTQRHH